MFDANQVQTYAPAAGHSYALVEGQRKTCSQRPSYIQRTKKNFDSILEKGAALLYSPPIFYAKIRGFRAKSESGILL